MWEAFSDFAGLLVGTALVASLFLLSGAAIAACAGRFGMKELDRPDWGVALLLSVAIMPALLSVTARLASLDAAVAVELLVALLGIPTMRKMERPPLSIVIRIIGLYGRRRDRARRFPVERKAVPRHVCAGHGQARRHREFNFVLGVAAHRSVRQPTPARGILLLLLHRRGGAGEADEGPCRCARRGGCACGYRRRGLAGARCSALAEVQARSARVEEARSTARFYSWSAAISTSWPICRLPWFPAFGRSRSNGGTSRFCPGRFRCSGCPITSWA